MLELKSREELCFMALEYWWKICRKTDLCFQKWHEEISKFLPEYVRKSKNFWWDPFIQSWKYMSLKFTEELCVTIMKYDLKFEEALTCPFKIDMRNFTSFDPSTQKNLINLHFNGLLLNKVYVWEGVMFDGTKDWCKIWRKIYLRFLK